MDGLVKNLPHLVHDSFQFEAAVATTIVPPGACMVCLDPKDLFLSWSSFELAKDASAMFDGQTAALVQEAALCLIENQFIMAE